MALFVSCQILLVTIGLSLSSRNFKVSADSPVLREALEKYHRELISDNKRISKLLLAKHGIDMK